MNKMLIRHCNGTLESMIRPILTLAMASVCACAATTGEKRENQVLPSALAPIATKERLFSPTFVTKSGEFAAGTAFVINDARSATGTLLLVTAHHLLGTAGGLDHEVPGDEVPSFVIKVALQDFSGAAAGEAKPALRIAGAGPGPQVGAARDLAAFAAPSSLASRAFKLAAKQPSVGDVIWLFASLADARGRLLHRATVIESTDDRLEYRFGDRISLSGASGAPILNQSGEIVGLHVMSRVEGKHRVGTGNTAVSIRSLVAGSFPGE